jgi:hypothetical protein
MTSHVSHYLLEDSPMYSVHQKQYPCVNFYSSSVKWNETKSEEWTKRSFQDISRYSEGIPFQQSFFNASVNINQRERGKEEIRERLKCQFNVKYQVTQFFLVCFVNTNVHILGIQNSLESFHSGCQRKRTFTSSLAFSCWIIIIIIMSSENGFTETLLIFIGKWRFSGYAFE